MDRAPGLSARLKLTLSYAGFLMLAGVLMLAAVWVVVLRYIPDGVLFHMHPSWWFLFDRSCGTADSLKRFDHKPRTITDSAHIIYSTSASSTRSCSR